MATVASKVPFKDLCDVCEKISLKKGNELKRKVLVNFVKVWREFHIKLHRNDTQTEDSFYPAMRLLLPQFEKERGAYGIKETTLSKLYIEILGLNKDSGDAQKLLNFRNPKNSKANAGDFATVAYYVLINRCPANGTLKISQVNEDLDGVSLCHANQDKDGVKRHLKHLLRNTSAMEQKWLIRMIMKELKFGLSEQSIFSVYHSDASDLYDVTNNLQKVCISLKNPEVRLHEIEISIFSPFRPMLADRASPEKVENLMHNNAFYIETKHDGERMQLHKKGGEFKYFSRGGNEYTESYGATRLEGNLTPHIAELFDPSVKECILDGEMVGYSSKTDCIGTKAENFDVKALKDGDFYHPCFCVFDILLLNEKVLSNLPLKQRMEHLDKAFKTKKGRLLFTNRTEGKTKQDAADALNIAIDNREEGIVIKDPNSVYRPNTRKGGWIKLKPEYVDSMMDQLDLLIIGGYFGEGHRRGMISHFLLAVAVPPKPGEEYPSEFHSITKVGSGYSMSELYEMCQKLSQHWKTYDKRNPPKSVILAPGHKERPDLWVEPSNSFIVQVKAAEFVDSNQFKTGCTLRFPRVEKVRYDKPWHQCMTITEMDELKQLAAGKLATKHFRFDDETAEGEAAKKRKKVAAEQPVTLAPQFLTIDASSVTQISKLFEGKEFCVINGSHQSKPELEKLIVENGGTIVQNPGAKTFSVIADQVKSKVNNLIKANRYDIVKSRWVLNCLKENQFLARLPSDFMHMSANTALQFSEEFDRFGDSYTQPVDPNTLKEIFAAMSPQETSTSEIYAMEQEYFPHLTTGLFRPFDFYLDIYLIVGDTDTKISSTALSLVKADLIFHGATVSDVLHDKVTHVVVESSNLERVDEFRRINQRRRKKFRLVIEKWVVESVNHSKIAKEINYEP